LGIFDSLATIKRILAPEFSELITSLRPGATEAQIMHLEEVIEQSLPENFKELYRLHDGESDVSGLFFGTIFMDLRMIEQDWLSWKRLANDTTLTEEFDIDCLSVPYGWVQERYACPGWIPFGTNYDGNFLGIDLDPGPEGISGQVINFGRDEETKYVIASNLTLFFEFLVAILESGNFQAGGHHPMTLKVPPDAYFMEGVEAYRLYLPYGMTRPANPHATLPEMPFEEWFATLGRDWQEIISDYFGPPESAYQELAAETHLWVKNTAISDIRPLTRFTGLRVLDLINTQVADISPLRACKLLKKLDLAGTRVTDLSPLSELQHLAYLSLDRTEATDLSPLSHLPGLIIE
jgi:internalin A